MANIYDSLIQETSRIGNEVLRLWPGNPSAPALGKKQKADQSWVTDGDYFVNDRILKALRALVPDDLIISEEEPLPETLPRGKRQWFIDPIDGTSIFMSGSPHFGILVAHYDGNDPIFALAEFPALKLTLHAVRGGGTFLNGRRVQQPATPTSSSFLCIDCQITHPQTEVPAARDTHAAIRNLATGTLAGLLYGITCQKSWDIAPYPLLISESGGICTDELGSPIRLEREHIPHKIMVASHHALHSEAIKVAALAQGTQIQR